MKYAKIDINGQGDTILVAAVPERKIRLITYLLASAGGGVSVTWKSGSTPLSGPMAVAAGGNLYCGNTDSLPGHVIGVLETEPGESLTLNLDSIGVVGGHLVYLEVAI